ncbi:MAG: helix-turn-helix transcriptional regulator [Bacteroidetes bacterium]|nr:helix-turn-helix transcriptional regulator [Bacteroidota bacterium]
MVHKIKKALEASKLTHAEFADKVGISRDTVYKLNDETIKLATIEKICQVLGLDFAEFIIQAVKISKVSEPLVKYEAKQEDCKTLKRMNDFLMSQVEADRVTITALNSTIERLSKLNS